MGRAPSTTSNETARALSAKVIDATGLTTRTRDLPAELFGGTVNLDLLHQAVTAQLAAARSGTASTKTRSEVRGGGKKPWRQKGTGRARHGSSRSPIWVGGGTVFGPKPRDHSVRLPRKMRKAALRSALADKARFGTIWIVEDFIEGKTKIAAAALASAGIEGRTLVVLDAASEADLVVDRAFRNLKDNAFSLVGALSTYDVLVADHVLFSSAAFERFTAPPGDEGQGDQARANDAGSDAAAESTGRQAPADSSATPATGGASA